MTDGFLYLQYLCPAYYFSIIGTMNEIDIFLSMRKNCLSKDIHWSAFFPLHCISVFEHFYLQKTKKLSWQLQYHRFDFCVSLIALWLLLGKTT